MGRRRGEQLKVALTVRIRERTNALDPECQDGDCDLEGVFEEKEVLVISLISRSPVKPPIFHRTT